MTGRMSVLAEPGDLAQTPLAAVLPHAARVEVPVVEPLLDAAGELATASIFTLAAS